MAYDGYGGGPQRPYAGAAAPRPPPPQQYGAPQQYDNYQEPYGYDDYNGGYGPDYGGQYQDQGYAQGMPPPRGRGGRPAPSRERGGYPPRGGSRGPPPARGMYNGGPQRGRGGGGGYGQYHEPQDPGAARRPPMGQPPISPRKANFGNGAYPEHQIADQMSSMDLNGQYPARPSAESQRSHGGYGQAPPDSGRGPPGRGYPQQRNHDPRAGPAPGQAPSGRGAYDDGYGGRGPGPQRNDFPPLERSMTMPVTDHNGRQRVPGPHSAGSTPMEGFAGQGIGGRPATATGSRMPPQRSYTSDTRGPQQGQYGGEYNDPAGRGQHAMNQHEAGYGAYYDDSSNGGPDPRRGGHPSQSNLPNPGAQAPGVPRSSSDQPRPGSEQQQGGLRQPAQLNHAKSQPDFRKPQAAVFDMAGDAPSVPPVPQGNSYRPGFEQGYNQMLSRGPPGAMSSQSGPNSGLSTESSQSRGLPASVRPGVMPEKPPPVRNYGGIPQAQSSATQQQQQRPQQPQQLQPTPQVAQPQQQVQAPPPPQSRNLPTSKPIGPPVTTQELEQLRMVIKNNPNDQESAMRLANRLIEAADALVPNLPDPKARGRARERYLMDASKILKKLANTQNPEAMFVFADAVGRGLFGSEPDPKEAFTLYQSAAKIGHAGAAYRTAVCCEIGNDEGGGTRKDPLKAIQWYKRAATLGDPPAMYKLGMILLKGLLGQQKNPREAVSWLKRAAERADAENPHALHELGLLYESAQPNDVIIRDEAYALDLFHQAAELGYKFSQYRLGAAYEYALMNCPIDPRLSIMWYSRAATQEEHQSELALSGWYLTGSEGVLGQSDTEAYLWARKAAIAGLAKAEYAMGYFTEVGIGIAANLEDAKRWYWRAAAQDYPKARERLEELKRAGRSAPRQRERISRNQKQQEGDCTVM